MNKRDIPTKRYDRDVLGMPCYAAKNPFEIMVSYESRRDAIPKDDENCAIAIGCRKQLETPYVSVGRRRTEIAMPHPDGVIKPGFGRTRWAVYRFENTQSAMAVIIAADTGDLDEEAVTVRLRPPRPSDSPTRKRSGIETGVGRKLKGRGHDRLTALGVRDLTGQRKRPTD